MIKCYFLYQEKEMRAKKKKEMGKKKKGDKRRRRQITLTPRVVVEGGHRVADSSADTVPGTDNPFFLSDTSQDITQGETSVLNSTYMSETPGLVLSEGDSLSELGDSDDEFGDGPVWNENGPMRDDMPITTGRWQATETDALMVAINHNRAAIKFHFQGAGGGKDVKRTAWKDVTGTDPSFTNFIPPYISFYLNDT